MGFKNLPPQPDLYPAEAAAYSAEAIALSAAAAERCRTEQDIAYGAHPLQQLDLYLPERASRAPVLVFAHGGAWTHGIKEWMGLMAPPLLAAGIILVSVNYRLGPKDKFPAALEDCLAALAWTHKNIARYGGDAARIAVGGHSAGGHLYALAALRTDLFARFGLPANPVVACLPVSGQMNMVFPERLPDSPEARVYETFLPDDAAGAQASPIRYIARGMPHFVFAYGGADFARIIRGNREMAAALRAEGIAHDEIVFDGFDHFRSALELRHPTNPWVLRVLDLLVPERRRKTA